jgi:hypothetical protein
VEALPGEATVCSSAGCDGLLTSACSDDDSDRAPLEGVDDATAEQLCNSFLELGDPTNLVSDLHPDELSRAAASYEGLADEARDGDANDFATIADDAADASDELSQAIGEDDRTGSELLTLTYRLQLADATLRLACAERGFTVFDS